MNISFLAARRAKTESSFLRLQKEGSSSSSIVVVAVVVVVVVVVIVECLTEEA